MDNYTKKTQELIKKFAGYFASVKIDDELKEKVITAFAGKNIDCAAEQTKAKDKKEEFVDLRIAVFDNGTLKRIFPEIAVANKKDTYQSHAVITEFAAFEMSALLRFFNKEEHKFEDLQEFVAATYTPSENRTGKDNLLTGYFNLTLFFFNDGTFDFVVKPNIQYVLTPENKISEGDILKLI